MEGKEKRVRVLSSLVVNMVRCDPGKNLGKFREIWRDLDRGEFGGYAGSFLASRDVTCWEISGGGVVVESVVVKYGRLGIWRIKKYHVPASLDCSEVEARIRCK